VPMPATRWKAAVACQERPVWHQIACPRVTPTSRGGGPAGRSWRHRPTGGRRAEDLKRERARGAAVTESLRSCVSKAPRRHASRCPPVCGMHSSVRGVSGDGLPTGRPAAGRPAATGSGARTRGPDRPWTPSAGASPSYRAEGVRMSADRHQRMSADRFVSAVTL
jgi:hypothetical protein